MVKWKYQSYVMIWKGGLKKKVLMRSIRKEGLIESSKSEIHKSMWDKIKIEETYV